MTAREFFKQYLNDNPNGKYDDCMIEFAKYHVKQAILKIEKEVNAGLFYAYPLENIK